MRCDKARERIARQSSPAQLAGDRELASHLEACQSCAGEWRIHLALLAELESAPSAPPFPDLSPRVLSALDAPRGGSSRALQWAAAAAFAVLALALGFLFGSVSVTQAAPPESMAATYQRAITTLPSNPAELASLEYGARPAARSLR